MKPPLVTPTDPRVKSFLEPVPRHEATLPDGTRIVVQESIILSKKGEYYCYTYPRPKHPGTIPLGAQTLNEYEAVLWLQSQLPPQ